MTHSSTEAARLIADYERILEIGRQINSTLEHRSLLQQIMSAVTEILDTEAASIMLLDPVTGELRFEIASNINPATMKELIIPIEGSIAGWIVTHGESRVIEDVASEPEHFGKVDTAIQFKTRNLLGVPLRTHKKVIGVLQAVNKRSGKFTEHDISTLTMLASQAGIAIENARMFRQSDFIAEMVHELRAPLAALKASLSLLARPNLPDDKRQDIHRLLGSETDRLIRLTTDFLDLAQLESGRTRLDIQPFELYGLISESVDIVRQQAADKNVVIHVPEGELLIEGDRGKLKQVLLNLLTNAVKYNRPDGEISVDVQTGSGDVLVMVSDTGYGVSEENQKQMFQKFFRAADTSGFTQGTGLGLAITKHIVEAHGGQIWLESELNVGSTFYMRIPVYQS
ncbi:MAG TPA: GAF domain-containing sensor histidine kinase [Aggregatilineales bacterium]|jgi:signal transduction histidine kinase|nr:GAF domain-containing sensor histidine kinase [Aggregatilineales bacterium]